MSEVSLEPEENGFQVLEGARGPFHQHKVFPWPWRTGLAEVGFEGGAKGC